MPSIWMPAFAALISGVLATWLAVKVTVHFKVYDHPNHRSGHQRPTPRTGGTGLLAGFLTGSGALVFLLLSLEGDLPLPTLSPSAALSGWSFKLAGLLVCTVILFSMGLIDDLKGLSASKRFPIQFVCCLLFLVAFTPLPAQQVPVFSTLHAGWILPLTAIGLLWWLNLYNFMDGMDSLASGQAFAMVLSGLIAIGLDSTGINTVWQFGTDSVSLSKIAFEAFLVKGLMLCLLSATLALLAFNWHPAKIFLGDCGSVPLAFIVFALAIWSIQLGLLGYHFWLITGALFVSDATVTLLSRLRKRERITEAHRQHAYQRLLDNQVLHVRSLSLVWLGINLFILGPLAFWAQTKPLLADALLVLVYALSTGAVLLIHKRYPAIQK